VASSAAYYLIGPGPLAANYEPTRFAVTERTECGNHILQMIPPAASVSAQDNLMPHLAHRPVLNVFPSLGDPPDDYVAIDTHLDLSGGYSNWPFVRPLEVPAEVNRFLSRPTYTLVGDGCDYKLLRYSGGTLQLRPLNAIFGQQVRVLGYEVAVKESDGLYRVTVGALTAGSEIRLTLWWRAEQKPQTDYTAFVHALDAGGQIAGQHDSPPANGFRPTATWAAGEIVKDIHYLTVERDMKQFSVGLYDGRTGQRLITGEGVDAIILQ
jgi:hypothetical protein